MLRRRTPRIAFAKRATFTILIGPREPATGSQRVLNRKWNFQESRTIMRDYWSRKLFISFLFLSCLFFSAQPASPSPSARWTEKAANDWYAKQRWLVGSNYIPATAINELEMWQQDSFDPQRIDLELGWAESIGLNTMRVFLHDLPWQQDPEGFRKRIDSFLQIAAKHHIGRFLYYSILAGPRIRNSASSVTRVPASTIPAGCKAPGRRRSRIRRNIRALKNM